MLARDPELQGTHHGGCRIGGLPEGFPAGLMKGATRQLSMLDAAVILNDLRSPPGNRLEALSGDRAGRHSLRIDAQWRLCFIWTEAGAMEVEEEGQ